jgi:hypothetical protein
VSACEVRVEHIDNPCGKPAISRFAYGCVHEHVTRALACREHTDLLRDRDVYCQNCQQHDGHECLLGCREIALPAEAAL